MFGFFIWLIFLVSSPPSTTTLRFPHSFSAGTSLGKPSKFPMSHISIPSGSPIATFFIANFIYSECKTRTKKINICERGLLHFNLFIFRTYLLLYSVKNIVKEANQIKKNMIDSLKLTTS